METLILNNYPFTNTENTIGGIYIVRDPRDVVLSNANHFGVVMMSTNMLTDNMKIVKYNFDENLKKSTEKVLWVHGQVNYFLGKLLQRKKIHLMKYEDLVENPKKFYKNVRIYKLNNSFKY